MAILVSACSGSAATPAPSAAASARRSHRDAARQRAAASAAAASTAASMAPCGTVNIADNAWVGYEADVAVVNYLLINKLGCTVNIKNINEQVAWQGFPTGEVDVILENWGHEDLAKKYITDQKVAVDLGSQGNVGIIGWYVPQYYADAHPDLMAAAGSDPKNFAAALNTFARTSPPASPAARASSSTATRPTSPTTRPSSTASASTTRSSTRAPRPPRTRPSRRRSTPRSRCWPTSGRPTGSTARSTTRCPAQAAAVHRRAATPTPRRSPATTRRTSSTRSSRPRSSNSGSPAVHAHQELQVDQRRPERGRDRHRAQQDDDDDAAKKWLDAHPDVWKAWFAGTGVTP